MFGIYAYIDKKTNEIVYIGKDSNIDKKVRHNAHLSPKRYDDQQINKVLQNNLDRYDYQELIVLDHTPTNEEFNGLEIELINQHSPKFNFTKGGEGLLGYNHSEKTKRKISEAQKGEKNHAYGKTPWNKGKTGIYSEETLKKMSESRKGKNYGMVGENHPSYGKPAWNKGKNRSDEVKQKISESHKGKKLSDETKLKLSEKLSGENNPRYGKTLSDETKEKIRQANLGQVHSDETKLNMVKSRNTTGIYRVHKKKNKRLKQGFNWAYQYRDENNNKKVISNCSLDKLKQKVLEKGLEWHILDEDKLNKTLNELGELKHDK